MQPPAHSPDTAAQRLAVLAGLAVFAVVAAYYAMRPGLVLGDPDLWWHVRIGQDIIANRAVPYVDQYSYTFEGKPWIAKEWLSQVLLGAAFNLGGWSGVLLASVFAAAAALTAFYLELSRHFRIGLAAGITLAVAAVLSPVIVARPHLFSLVLMVVLAARLFRAAAEARAPAWWLLILIALWANLHGSFTLALVIGGFAFLDMALTTRLGDRPLLFRWIAFMVLALGATLLTPYGIALYTINLDMISGVQTMAFITEWQPFSAKRDRYMEYGLLLAIAGLIAMRARPSLMRILFIVLTLHMFLTYVRFAYVFFLLVPIVVAGAAAAQTPLIARRRMESPDGLQSVLIASCKPIAACMAALILAGFLGIAALHPFKPEKRRAIEDALAFIRSQDFKGPVMNGYNLGGVLIFNGFKVFLDGRTEQLYRGAFMEDYLAAAGINGGEAMGRMMDTYKPGWAIFTRRDLRNRFIAATPGWSKAYEDDFVIIHVNSALQH